MKFALKSSKFPVINDMQAEAECLLKLLQVSYKWLLYLPNEPHLLSWKGEEDMTNVPCVSTAGRDLNRQSCQGVLG